MTPDRYNALMDNSLMELNEDEIEEGWHFCWDYDGLLIHKDDEEYQNCQCTP